MALVRQPVARKEHTCNVCKKPIKIGEQYIKMIEFPNTVAYNMGDGEYEEIDNPFTQWKLHKSCYYGWETL